MSYQPKVYRKQGSDELVVASGGTITVESGGTISVADGGVIVQGAVVTETTAANLAANGVSLVVAQTSGTGTNTYTIDAPVAGVTKTITATQVTNATTDNITIVGPTTTTLFNTAPKLRFIAVGSAQLIGRTTLVYDVIGGTTTVVVPGT